MGRLGIRWTLRDVSSSGFEALRLSLWGATRAFVDRARHPVFVNTVPLANARRLLGDVPPNVELVPVERAGIPTFLLERFDQTLAEGVGWKVAKSRQPLEPQPRTHKPVSSQ